MMRHFAASETFTGVATYNLAPVFINLFPVMVQKLLKIQPENFDFVVAYAH
jgi:hypothetical protein